MNLPPMTEKQFQARTVQLAEGCGFLCYHTHDSRRSDPGFPDVVMVNGKSGVVLFVEFKSDKGKLRPDQVKWAQELHKVMCHQNQRVYQRVWRPCDQEEIEQFLTEKG